LKQIKPYLFQQDVAVGTKGAAPVPSCRYCVPSCTSEGTWDIHTRPAEMTVNIYERLMPYGVVAGSHLYLRTWMSP